jgi:hypothetical protein
MDESGNETCSDSGKDGLDIRVGELWVYDVAAFEETYGEETIMCVWGRPDSPCDTTGDEDTDDIEPGIEEKDFEVGEESSKNMFLIFDRDSHLIMSSPSLFLDLGSSNVVPGSSMESIVRVHVGELSNR